MDVNFHLSVNPEKLIIKSGSYFSAEIGKAFYTFKMIAKDGAITCFLDNEHVDDFVKDVRRALKKLKKEKISG